MNLINELKQSFRSGTTLIKLIYINAGIFILIKLIGLFYFLFNIPTYHTVPLVAWLAVPADLYQLLFKPWTIITYMFLHQDFFHILFNMLWLYWFGKIFLEYLDQKKLLSTYLIGGLAGALFYIFAFAIFPVFKPQIEYSIALGASASVLAIVIAISVYVPNYTIHLLFLGPIKLKYIAVFAVVIDLLSIPSGNSGGHIAHLGGALYGYWYIQQFRKGKDISRKFSRFMDSVFTLFKPKPKTPFTYTYKRPESDSDFKIRKVKEQEEIDRILEKIKMSGYDSLSKDEKEKLFRMSQ